MKHFLFSVFFFLASASCIAQQIMWEKLYGVPGGNEVVGEIYKLTDTTFATLGVDQRYNGRIFYHKIDQHGNYIWQKTGRIIFHGEHTMTLTADGGYIIAGNKKNNTQPLSSDLYLQKTNSSGDTLWTQVYATPTERINWPTQVLELSNKDLVVLGHADLGVQRSYSLLLTDSLGNQKWYKHFAKSLNAYSAGMVLSHKGNFVLSGYTTPNTVTLHARPYLVEVSPNGDSISSKSFVIKNVNFSEVVYRVYNNINQTQDSGYVFSGYYDSLAHTSQQSFYLRGMIVKTDTAFNVQWSFFFQPPNNSFGVRITKVREQPDGSLLFLANDEFSSQPKFYLVHLSKQGQFLSYQTYSSQICSGGVRPYDFTMLSDSSAILVGVCYASQKGYLARVKDIYSGSTVLSVPEALPGRKAPLADAYPNPASSEVTIPYLVPEKCHEAKLLVHELVTGRLVREVPLTQKGNGQAQLSINGLTTGMYTYSLIVDGKRIATKKLFVMKQ